MKRLLMRTVKALGKLAEVLWYCALLGLVLGGCGFAAGFILKLLLVGFDWGYTLFN